MPYNKVFLTSFGVTTAMALGLWLLVKTAPVLPADWIAWLLAPISVVVMLLFLPGGVAGMIVSANFHDPNDVAVVLGSGLFWAAAFTAFIALRRRARLARGTP